ncbi:MAG: Ig-like domain-containing protein [Gemmatimonadaceae bacterium]
MRHGLTLLALAAAIGCASQGYPPGGPEDSEAPVIVSVRPDSGALNTRPRDWMVFAFDEVLSERPQGSAATLGQLVLISPRDGAPRVDWRRKELAVRPRRDWRPNVVYTVTLLPGISDLRNNVRQDTRTVVFSTGSVIPPTRIVGAVFNWVQGQAAPSAVVEAIAPDSTKYVAVADRSGRYVIANLPPGVYTLRAYLDANNNLDLDPREAWDSAAVSVTDSARSDVYAFVHDSVGPRLTSVEQRDSLTSRVRFDRGIAPDQAIDTALFRLRAADSSVVPIVAARAARDYERATADSAARDSAARDSVARRAAPVPRRAVADTAPPPPTLGRPAPVTEVILQVFPPLKAGTTYRVTAAGIRGLLGQAATSERSFTVPAPPAVPPAARPAGAARPPADTTRRPPR